MWEGAGDLKVWFRIWSEAELAAIPKPTFLPDVKIQDVDIPSDVRRAPDLVFIPAEYNLPHTLTIANNELMDVWIDWQAYSFVTGDFGGGNILVPAGGQKTITDNYFYKTAGTVEISYTISYKGIDLDSWSGTMVVLT